MNTKRPLLVALALVAGCATAPAAQGRAAERAGTEVEAKCRLYGSASGRPGHSDTKVLDEKRSMGPVRVLWLAPPAFSLVTTQEGLVYACDRRL
jgi:hypothetical protein